MADKRQQPGSGEPQQHPLIDRLTGGTREGAAAQPPDVSILSGYPARDPQPGFWRIYQDLSFQSYLRVTEDDIVGTQTLATDDQPLLPSAVWVRRGAELEQVRVDTRRLQAGFLQGPLVEGLAEFTSGAARTRRTAPLTRDREVCSIDICQSRDVGGCFTHVRACVSVDRPCGGGGGGGASGGALCPSREFVCGPSVGCSYGIECTQEGCTSFVFCKGD
jgi:hypothetical protein